jgi:hypothetical protein
MVERPAGDVPRQELDVPVSAAERIQRFGHRSAVLVSRSKALLASLERALFARGAAVAALQALPPAAALRELLANGLILLAPSPRAERRDAGLIEVAEKGTTSESVDAILCELERRGVLLTLRREEN